MFSFFSMLCDFGQSHLLSGPQSSFYKKHGSPGGGPDDLEMSFYLEWLLRALGGGGESPGSQSLGAGQKM